MTLMMDAAALQAFLVRDFGQVATEFKVERADAGGVTLRLQVAARHLRPGGTVSSTTRRASRSRSCRGSGPWLWR